jgi:hypothetical protein
MKANNLQRQVLRNASQILEASGSDMSKVVCGRFQLLLLQLSSFGYGEC